MHGMALLPPFVVPPLVGRHVNALARARPPQYVISRLEVFRLFLLSLRARAGASLSFSRPELPAVWPLGPFAVIAYYGGGKT